AGSCRVVPDPSEVFQTRRGGAMDPHTRLPGYTCSTMLGVTQVWFAAHHVGHVLKTLRSGRLDELHRRMKRNPHVLDARVCRAVLWWSILGEAMEAAGEAERRRAKRRESRRLVVALAVSQRRGRPGARCGCGGAAEKGRPEQSTRSGLPRTSSRNWSLPPMTAAAAAPFDGGSRGLFRSSGGGGDGSGRAACHGGSGAALARVYLTVHLDEAAILGKIYELV
ncbi:unnamed protein product, partial [Hapterophycus canaliculatus]